MPADPIGILAIGASTGGIHALGTLFQNLPKQIGVPILITQHLPAPFMSVFARQLGVVARRECVVAENGMPLVADRILVAPGDSHLTLEPSDNAVIVRLAGGRSASGCMPSVDPMLASVGAIYGSGALGVVLTGMGRDGVEGASRLVASGGSVIDPLVVDELASNFPNLTIIAAHPGWPWIEEMTAVALHKGNVYWELSGWAPKYFPDSLKKDVRGRLRDKVMFGSDYPSLPYERILREWEELDYPEEVMEGVFHGNAERVLGLMPEPKKEPRAVR